jgi:hypothetical protein
MLRREKLKVLCEEVKNEKLGMRREIEKGIK